MSFFFAETNQPQGRCGWLSISGVQLETLWWSSAVRGGVVQGKNFLLKFDLFFYICFSSPHFLPIFAQISNLYPFFPQFSFSYLFLHNFPISLSLLKSRTLPQVFFTYTYTYRPWLTWSSPLSQGLAKPLGSLFNRWTIEQSIDVQ